MKNESLSCLLAIKAGLVLLLLAVFPGAALCDDMAPSLKPALRFKPNLEQSIPKPWTDYVVDSLIVKREPRGNVKVKVKAKNLGDNNKDPVWIAVGINRPGAQWIEIGNGGGWYMLLGKANIHETVEIKAMVDSKKVINEIKEVNNECSVHLAPGATNGRSSCY